MINYDSIPSFELMYVIVNYGSGSRVLHKAKEYGIYKGTVVLARGTVYNSLLNFFSLYDEKKEIVLMATDKHIAENALVGLNKDFKFEKPNHGIVFTTSICEIVGSKCCICKQKEERGVNEPMYQLIITIVNRGKAEEVIEASKVAGAKGGTIINTRGSNVHETSKLFNMEIEPEKEVVMILTKENITKAVVSSIRESLDIDKPGNGIIFIQNVNKTYGIYE